jgi:hypothetical protein
MFAKISLMAKLCNSSSDVGCGISGVGCGISGVGCGISDVGCGISGVGCGISGVGCGCGIFNGGSCMYGSILVISTALGDGSISDGGISGASSCLSSDRDAVSGIILL